MNLGEIAAFVTKKVGQIDDYSLTLCRDYIQARYAMIYDSFPWIDSQINANVTLLSAHNLIELPSGMDRVVSIRATSTNGAVPSGVEGEPVSPRVNVPFTANFLEPINANLMMQIDPTIFER